MADLDTRANNLRPSGIWGGARRTGEQRNGMRPVSSPPCHPGAPPPSPPPPHVSALHHCSPPLTSAVRRTSPIRVQLHAPPNPLPISPPFPLPSSPSVGDAPTTSLLSHRSHPQRASSRPIMPPPLSPPRCDHIFAASAARAVRLDSSTAATSGVIVTPPTRLYSPGSHTTGTEKKKPSPMP